jgi:pentatricopeptide repeat protein
MPLAPRLVLTPEQEDRPPYAARRILPPEDEDHDMALRRFNRLLDRPLGTSVNQIWNSYQRLQGPRPRYLTDMAINRTFRHLTWVEFKDAASSRRYFAFLNEVLAERIPVHRTQWNSSISFAARWIKNTTSEEVKKAIETWLRMENAGIQATIVTFNILFDAAIRAGRFALADTICNEIKQRKLTPDRSFRISMIYYAGLRRDGDAVRQAFRELVNGGEIVDTTVMNCVIVSLVRAGEGASAENAYLKMKHLHETKFGIPGSRNWRERKLRGIDMHQTARQLRRDKAKHESSFFGGAFSSDDKKEEAQRRAPIHPDAHTYRILIRYNAYTSGNLDRCRDLLNETKDGGWPVHGSVYLFLFRGFYLHGGHAYTAWNRRSLEEFWADFIDASSPEKLKKAEFFARAERESELGENISFFPDAEEDDAHNEDNALSHEIRPPYFTPNLARVVIHAFYKCAGRKRMLQAWAETQDRWTDMTPDDKTDLQRHVNRLVADDSRYVE